MYKASTTVIKRVNMVRPAAHAASFSGASTSTADWTSNKIEINCGAITDGVHTPTLYDAPDGATWTAVSAANMVGAFVPLVANSDQQVSYIGAQPYVQVQFVVAGATDGGIYGAGAEVTYRLQD